MTQFDTKGPQNFTEGDFTVLLKDEKGKIFLSKEMSDLYGLIWDEASKLLDWIDWHHSSYFKRFELIPEWSENNEYNFLCANISWFILENKKIILDEIEN